VYLFIGDFNLLLNPPKLTDPDQFLLEIETWGYLSVDILGIMDIF
jgi:hypothetical protein